MMYKERLRETGLFSSDTQQGLHSSLTAPLSKLLRRWSQAEVHDREGSIWIKGKKNAARDIQARIKCGLHPLRF